VNTLHPTNLEIVHITLLVEGGEETRAAAARPPPHGRRHSVAKTVPCPALPRIRPSAACNVVPGTRDLTQPSSQPRALDPLCLSRALALSLSPPKM